MKKICKWYNCCPIKFFTDQGKLDKKWVESYCLVGNKECVRYQMEENGTPHPDNMLPNGEIKQDLK
ncbi:MAG: uracil-DNA glycosylase [Candidatus Lokiarchaeota archaeon]|nr:uracil-DNA glycosylase [Candidatus Lokiarchaeota archaeon]